MIHCVHRGYPTISIFFSEVVLLCCLCKSISYSFTRLAIFYLKHPLQQDSLCSSRCFNDVQRLIHLFPGVLHEMTVCHFEYVADIFHINTLFCYFSDGFEASKSVGSNQIVRQKEINKELFELMLVILCWLFYIKYTDIYIYTQYTDIYTYMILMPSSSS